MKVKFDNHFLEERLIKLIEEENSLKDVDLNDKEIIEYLYFLENAIDNYYYLLSLNNKEYMCCEDIYTNKSIKEMLIDMKNDINDIPNDLWETLKTVIYKLEKNIDNKKCEDFILPKVKVSNEELIENNKQLLERFDKKYFQIINKALEEKRINIASVNYDDNDGFCYLDYINNIAYGVIFKNNTHADFGLFNHEMMHIVEFYTNKDNLSCLTSEAYQIFMLLLTNYIEYNNGEDINLFAYKNYYEYIKDCLLTSGKLLTIKNYNYDKIKIYTVNRLLKEKYNIENKINKKSFLCVDFSDYMRYYSSAIIAFHLLDTYMKDEDKAIYLLNKGIKTESGNYEKLFKNIEMDYKDSDYVIDLFNKQDEFVNNGISRILKK